MTEPPASDEHAPSQRLVTATSTPLEDLRQAVLDAAEGLAGSGGDRGAISLERPRRAEFGDSSTNAALLLAPGLGAPPRELAESLGEALHARLGSRLERYEGAGAGFLNLFVSAGWVH